MTNEEKTEEILEIVRKSVIPRYQDGDYKDNYFDEVKECCMEMAEWKDKQYKALIDLIVDFINNGAYDCETFNECMPEWCEKNCSSHNPNFNADCIKNWIKKQNEQF